MKWFKIFLILAFSLYFTGFKYAIAFGETVKGCPEGSIEDSEPGLCTIEGYVLTEEAAKEGRILDCYLWTVDSSSSLVLLTGENKIYKVTSTAIPDLQITLEDNFRRNVKITGKVDGDSIEAIKIEGSRKEKEGFRACL